MREAYEGSPSTMTFAIGGDQLPAISDIATAGGTQATRINVLDSSDVVLNALRAIRDKGTPCAFALPPDAQLAADSEVVWRAPDGTQRTFEIERGASTCSAQGFYTPDASREDHLRACPQACAVVSPDGVLQGELTVTNTCAP